MYIYAHLWGLYYITNKVTSSHTLVSGYLPEWWSKNSIYEDFY